MILLQDLLPETLIVSRVEIIMLETFIAETGE